MANGPNLADATPGVGHANRYQLVDRTGRMLGEIPVATLLGMIRQGRLFRSDRIAKDGRDVQALGSLREFAVVFDEINPATPRVDALRAFPEFAGEAEPLSLGRAFVRIYRGRHNGRLFVCANGAREEKVVVFRQGVPVNATSNIKDEWLGEVLRHQGLIDQATFDDAVRASQPDGPRLGEVLVERNKISARQLYRALAVQAMDRLLKLFQRGGTFQFVIDETAADEEILLLAGPRDVLETCLAASLSPQRVIEILAESGDPTLRVEVPPDLAGELNDGDRTVLTILEEGRPLSAALPRIAEALRLTTAEARSRVLFLTVFDCVQAGDPELEALEGTLSGYQGMNYFEMLDVRLGSTSDEVVAAYQKRVAEMEVLAGRRTTTRAAQQIINLLERARRILTNPEQRPLYERALQLGIDFDQPNARAKLKHSMLLERGKGLIAQQNYAEALAVLSEAAQSNPDDPETEIEVGWAQFLAGPRSGPDASEAKRRIERALEMDSDLERGYLVLGKIERMLGDKGAAQAHLKKVLTLVPAHREAEAEIRALDGKLTQRTRPGVASRHFEPRAFVAIGAALAVAILLGVLAHVPGGAEAWPTTQSIQLMEPAGEVDGKMVGITQMQQLRLAYSEEKLVETALRMGADKQVVTSKAEALAFLSEQDFARVERALEKQLAIPPDQRVLGSIEFHYDVGDTFWWMRRGLLLIFGFAFLAVIGRERLGKLPWMGEQSILLLLAPIYGVVIGLFSVTPVLASEPGTAFGMTMFHVVAEQVFFIWFLARTLNNNVHIPAVGAVITGLLYGIYQLSYTATLAQPGEVIMLQLLQISLFAGGAYALLAWRSRGILAPLLAHLAVNSTMMLRAILA